MTDLPRAYPPETTEGWYVLHQVFAWEGDTLRQTLRSDLRGEAERFLDALESPSEGWSAVVPLIGSTSDVMLVHFRPTLDAIADAQRAVVSVPAFSMARRDYSFLSVTEAGLYHASAQLAADATERGGSVGDAAYRSAMDARVAKERESAHVQRRLSRSSP